MELTPWELRNGRWYKREDAYRDEVTGVNGSKFRAARHLMQGALEAGYDHVVSASSVLSPQAAMTAVLAHELGMKCTIIVGATTPDKAVKHRSIEIAAKEGAEIETVKVAYNPFIQKAGREYVLSHPGSWQMPYGITTPEGASPRDVEAFLRVGAREVANLPNDLRTLVIPFGSGNTTAGVLYGLTYKVEVPEHVVLVGVGPDRMAWLTARLGYVGLKMSELPFDLTHISLHGWFADYGDRMPETVDDIVLHPTYEGKVARYLNGSELDWWHRRDGSTGLWIVGGPI